MYCKICKHNFNSGETFANIGDYKICASCAFTTTVFDLIKRGLVQSETLDEDAINAEFVVVNTPSDKEVDKYMHNKQRLNSLYGMMANSTESDTPDYPEATPEEVEKFFTSDKPVFSSES